MEWQQENENLLRYFSGLKMQIYGQFVNEATL